MKKIKTWAGRKLAGRSCDLGRSLCAFHDKHTVVYSSIGTLAYKRTQSPESVLIKHTITVFVGLAAMWFAHKVDYRYYSKLSKIAHVDQHSLVDLYGSRRRHA
jgi:cell division protein FtsW